MGYNDVLRLQHETRARYQTERGLHHFREMYRLSFLDESSHFYDHLAVKDGESETFGHFLRSLEIGGAYAVSRDIGALLTSAAASLPEVTFTEALFPERAGYVRFATPLPIGSHAAILMALGWHYCPASEDHPPLVLLTTFRDGHLPLMTLAWMVVGETWRTAGPMNLLLSLLLFIRQGILSTEQQKVQNKGARRRLATHDAEYPAVRVVVLRKKARGEHDTTTSERSYSCQWLVRGHWRQQYFPASREHRPKWIVPYVKGPADKPLRVAGPVVYDVKR